MQNVSADFQTAAARPWNGAVLLVEAQFSSGTQRVTTWGATRYDMAQTWFGLGGLLSVDLPEENEDNVPQDFEVALSGIEQSMTALAVGDPSVYRRRPINIWFLICEPGGAPVDLGSGPIAPQLVVSGRMNNVSIDSRSDNPEIKLSCKTSKFGVRPPATALRANDQTHQARFAGELGFQYLVDLIGKPSIWLTKKFQQV